MYLFEARNNQGTRYAVKLMFKDDLDEAIFQIYDAEVKILAMLDHPNVVKYVENFQDERNMFIVM